MVTKPLDAAAETAEGFESCVVLDGNQTPATTTLLSVLFESCVVLDGNQTLKAGVHAAEGLRVVLF